MPPIAAKLVTRIVSQYEAGAITIRSACLDILMAAGESDPESVFAGLPECLREAVASEIADVSATEVLVLESYCGSLSNEEHAADLKRREEIMRRGIVALQRLTSQRK